MMRLLMRKGTIALFAAAMLAVAPSAFAADTVSVGSVDATSANLWPLQIARTNGYFDAAGINIDLVFAQSNASVIQQLAAGSYGIAPSAGIVDPIRAIDKGAPVTLVRIVIQAPPYALLAKPEIKTVEDLKGKTIMVGGSADITRLFNDRMMQPARAEIGRLRLCLRRRHQRAILGAEIRRGRCGAADDAVQLLRRDGGLQ